MKDHLIKPGRTGYKRLKQKGKIKVLMLIAMFWVSALALLYVVYLKIRFLIAH